MEPLVATVVAPNPYKFFGAWILDKKTKHCKNNVSGMNCFAAKSKR
jgi:hypothetical protein